MLLKFLPNLRLFREKPHYRNKNESFSRGENERDGNVGFNEFQIFLYKKKNFFIEFYMKFYVFSP